MTSGFQRVTGPGVFFWVVGDNLNVISTFERGHGGPAKTGCRTPGACDDQIGTPNSGSFKVALLEMQIADAQVTL